MLRLEKKPIRAAFVAGAVLAALTTTAAAQNLQLNVSPFSGAVTVQNTSGSPVSLDGYQITSAAGKLVPDPTNTSGVGWDSITDTGAPGWSEFAPTTTGLSELDLTSAKVIPAGGSVSLGFAFTAYGTKDVNWGYSVAGGGGASTATPSGAVHYGGGATLEVITLRGAGNTIESIPMILRNVESQVSVTFDAYVIGSASGSLNPVGFSGFAGHGVTGWGSYAPSANALSELNLTVTPALAAGRYQPLGTAFATGGTKDLTLEVHAIGGGFGDQPFQADVVYLDQLAGDANGDKVVNIFDINLISSNWNTAGLAGDTNYDGIVNIFDINFVSSHWANTAPGGGVVTAVPEPATLTLFALGLLAACRIVKRRN